MSKVERLVLSIVKGKINLKTTGDFAFSNIGD